VPAGADPSWVRYPVYVRDRAAAERALSPIAVPGTWFSSVLEEAVSPERGGYIAGSCPVAEDAARHLINLPTHPRVRADDAERIAAAVSC
jgi:dTDP-4-amino-4,6-dideoxygalactose transaminase